MYLHPGEEREDFRITETREGRGSGEEKTEEEMVVDGYRGGD